MNWMLLSGFSGLVTDVICGRGWGGGYFGGPGYGMMGGFGPFGMLLSGIFWLLVIGLVVWAVIRLINGKKAVVHSSESPLDILKRRLATGEITADEYAKIKKNIDEKK